MTLVKIVRVHLTNGGIIAVVKMVVVGMDAIKANPRRIVLMESQTVNGWKNPEKDNFIAVRNWKGSN
jgi:hypothetical protein